MISYDIKFQNIFLHFLEQVSRGQQAGWPDYYLSNLTTIGFNCKCRTNKNNSPPHSGDLNIWVGGSGNTTTPINSAVQNNHHNMVHFLIHESSLRLGGPATFSKIKTFYKYGTRYYTIIILFWKLVKYFNKNEDQ